MTGGNGSGDGAAAKATMRFKPGTLKLDLLRALFDPGGNDRGGVWQDGELAVPRWAFMSCDELRASEEGEPSA